MEAWRAALRGARLLASRPRASKHPIRFSSRAREAALSLVLACLLTIKASPVAAQGAKPTPPPAPAQWVQAVRTTGTFSGWDSEAVQFGDAARWQYFEVLGA